MSAASRQALARHNFEQAKLEHETWAIVIAQDCLAALEDWSKLPTRGMLARFKEAAAARDRAAEALFAASERVS